MSSAVSREIVSQSVVNVWGWLSSWLDDRGGVHGYVVHHHRDNLRTTSPDTWTQAACIIGCLNLYKLTKGDIWLDRATQLSDFLVDVYIPSLHVYANSNHEHKPLGKPEVVSNALPSYALLELSRTRQLLGLDHPKYSSIAADNITNYLLLGWDESVGAIASLDQGPGHFVLNMNGISAMALASYSILMKDELFFTRYAERMCDFICRNQVKAGPGKGSLPYRAGVTNSISLYSLISAYALFRVASYAHEERYLASSHSALEHLMGLYEPSIGLLAHHDARSPPYWLPDTALLHSLSTQLAGSGFRTEGEVSMARMLEMQYHDGGFPLSVGFADLFDRRLLPCRPGIRRWRDVLPTPNWNSWIFWHLSECLDADVRLPNSTIAFPHVVKSDKEEWEGPYIITDDGESVRFLGIDGRDAALFVKKQDTPLLCNIQERNEGFRQLRRLQRYPAIVRKAINAGADLLSR
jgi:hypothetical protein